MRKTVILLASVILLLAGNLFAQELAFGDEHSYTAPQLGILDVSSSSFDQAQCNMFTDVLRTEIFQIDYFRIIERGMIQQILQEQQISMEGFTDDSQLLEIGRLLAVEKLLVLKVDMFANTIVLNLRVIDVNTSILDFTQNVFLEDHDQIFSAIKDLVIQLQMYYIQANDQMDPQERMHLMEQNWIALGAAQEDLEYLIANGVDPGEYLDIRQYDITFTVKDYIRIKEEGWEIQTIKSFFQENIPYNEIEQALAYGISDVSHYQETFKPWQFSFGDYLDAYRNNVTSPQEYEEFQKGYDKDYLVFGLGGVANSLPIVNADFSFFVAQAGWEHYISNYQRNTHKYSTEMGLNFMNGIMPSPYFQLNYYIGSYPFYAKASLGVLAEIFVGGHVGVFARVGMELDSRFEINMMITFAGTQPEVAYTDFETQIGEEGYSGIYFPYMGAFLAYKY